MTQALEKIGKYKILRRIGKGGMGVVYCALDTVLEREIALKIHTVGAEPNVEAVERFFREARVIASLKHPNIVTVFDLGQEDDKVFIAMELLEGSDVTALMASDEHLTFETRLRIAENIAQGLAHGSSPRYRPSRYQTAQRLRDPCRRGQAPRFRARAYRFFHAHRK